MSEDPKKGPEAEGAAGEQNPLEAMNTLDIERFMGLLKQSYKAWQLLIKWSSYPPLELVELIQKAELKAEGAAPRPEEMMMYVGGGMAPGRRTVEVATHVAHSFEHMALLRQLADSDAAQKKASREEMEEMLRKYGEKLRNN